MDDYKQIMNTILSRHFMEALSDSELCLMLLSIHSELSKRTAKKRKVPLKKGTVLLDQCGITVYLKDGIYTSDWIDLRFPAVVVNDTDTKIMVNLDNPRVNRQNVKCITYDYDCLPPKSIRDVSFTLKTSQAGIYDIETIHEIEFKPYIIDLNNNVRITEAPEPITLYIPDNEE